MEAIDRREAMQRAERVHDQRTAITPSADPINKLLAALNKRQTRKIRKRGDGR